MAWIALAVFVLLFSLSTNLYEFVAANVLSSAQVLVVANPVDRFLDDTARLLMCGVGLVVLLRARGRRSSFALGIGMAGLAIFPIDELLADPDTALAADIVIQFVTGPVSWLIPAFAISMMRENGMPVPQWISWIFWTGLILTILAWSSLYLPGLIVLRQALFSVGLNSHPYFFAMALLLLGWSKSDYEKAHRFVLLFVAVSLIIAANLLFTLFSDGTSIYPRAVTNSATTLRITGSLLFAYAILKHRVIDIGFAVNRTLVCGAVAFTVLVIFGLLEYLAKITIPHAWPQAGSIVTAVIAVLLFLSFHHLHHWFEHHIERLFFHKWHLVENELKRFVASARQFTKASALCAEFVGELRRYAQVSQVALFLRRQDGSFCLETGALPGAADCYAEEDRAFALMSTEREPLELERAHSALPGLLAVPMLGKQGLSGFVLLGRKTDGSIFRPDEEKNIGWATQQVGYDLQALHARELEERLRELKDQNFAFRVALDKLRPAEAKN